MSRFGLESPGRLLVYFCLLLAAATQISAQRLIVEDETPPGGVFAKVGLGVIDVAEGTGLDIPMGITAISPPHRVMIGVKILALGLLQAWAKASMPRGVRAPGLVGLSKTGPNPR